MITTKQAHKVRKAAEAIDSGKGWWSCTTVERFAGDKVRAKYADFYDKNGFPVWPGLGMDQFSEKLNRKQRDHRIMLLLFFAEAKGTL